MNLQRYHLQPSPLPASYISRPHLLTQLSHAMATAKITLLAAPAGYGKSFIVAEFLKNYQSHWAYLPCERLRTTTACDVVMSLAKAFSRNMPDFASIHQVLSHECDETNVKAYMEALLEALGTLDQPLLVVLENYHDLSPDSLGSLLTQFIEDSPAHVSFLVTARFPPQWPARWFGSGMVAQIKPAALLFTQAECELLAHNLQLQLEQTDLEAIFRYIGGWPILWFMLYRNLQVGNQHQIQAVLKQDLRSEGEFFEVITQEFLNTLPAEDQDLVCKTAIVSSIDEDLCADAFGVEHAAVRLARLEQYGFLTCIDFGKMPVYIHRHEILRGVLRQQLRLRYGHEYEQLNIQVAIVYEKRKEHEQALNAYSQAGHIEEAVRIIKDHGLSLVLTTDLNKLDRWLNLIPQVVVDQQPELLVYQGIVQIEQQRELADIPLLRAVTLFEAREDIPGLLSAYIELIWLYYLRGAFDQAAPLVPKVLNQHDLLDPLRRGRLLFVVGMFHLGFDNFEKAKEYLRDATNLYRSLPSIAGKKALPRMLRFLGNTSLWLGQLTEALNYTREAFNMAMMLNLGSEARVWIKFQEGTILHYLGHFDEALAAFDETEQLMASMDPDYKQKNAIYDWVMTRRGHIYRDCGDFVRAQASYTMVQRGLKGISMAFLISQYGRAGEALPHAMERYRRTRDSMSPMDAAKNEGMLGITYLSLSVNDSPTRYEYLFSARKYLEQALQILDHTRANYILATFRFYLAKVYLSLGKPLEANKCLSAALHEMFLNDYYNLDVWQSWVAAELCAYAIQNNIEPEFAEVLALKRLGKQDSGPFVPLLTNLDAVVRSAAVRILKGLGLSPEVNAYELLGTAKSDKHTRQRLHDVLNQQFLTPTGLLRLHQTFGLSWREIDIFILWITPAVHGRVTKIAQIANISVAAVNDNIESIRHKLDRVLNDNTNEIGDSGTELERKRMTGLFIKFYEWALREGILIPPQPRQSEGDQYL